eukprot:m.58424 g.58424  ORF g.58424 m.58424 type:complete len:1374 (+) comp17222_c0_seq1:263-4384(+)
MEVRLRDYLGGYILRQALILFEGAFEPWVRSELKIRNPDTPEDVAYARGHVALLSQWEDQKNNLWKDRRKHLKEVKAKIKELRNGGYANDGKVAQLEAQSKEDIAAFDEGARLITANEPQSPIPRWIQVCRKPCGPRTKKHVQEDPKIPWDAHILVVLVRAYPEVFFQDLPDHWHVKDMLFGIQRVLDARTGRSHRNRLLETDVLDALSQMRVVLTQCKFTDAAANVKVLLDEAQLLVHKARLGQQTIRGQRLSSDECNAQRFYEAIDEWEVLLETELGAPLQYKNETIAFGTVESRLDDVLWKSAVGDLRASFSTIAKSGRHAYFHHTIDHPECDTVNKLMEQATTRLAKANNSEALKNWRSPSLIRSDTDVEIRLEMPASRMTVPINIGDEMRGRDDDILLVSTSLVEDAARVLIYGTPGVGKDWVMSQVTINADIQALGGGGALQAWLHGSSDVVFRRQLIELFTTHRPLVVPMVHDPNQLEKTWAAIKTWLAQNTDWLFFIEDVGLSSAAVWEVLPSANVGGRVLMTSQQRVHKTYNVFTKEVLLERLSKSQCIEILRAMNIFEKKGPSPRPDESEVELKQRASGFPECYVEPVPNEKSGDRKARRAKIESNVFAHCELASVDLATFVDSDLGGLPMSVSLCGQMLRADPNLAGVSDLIEAFRVIADLAEVDVAGKNEMAGRNMFGLDLSIRMCLDRLRRAPMDSAAREAATALLAAISVLDRSATPTSLLEDHSVGDLVADVPSCFAPSCRSADNPTHCFSPCCRKARASLNVFSNRAKLGLARDTCVRYGLLQEPGEGSSAIGVMHQMIQKHLLHSIVAETPEGAAVARGVRVMLRRRFTFKSRLSTPSIEWPGQQSLASCVEAWCRVVGTVVTCTPTVPLVREDVLLLDTWGTLVLEVDGNASEAMRIFEHARECRGDLVRVGRLPADSKDIGVSLINLAQAMSANGSSQDAFTTQSEALVFFERHPPSSPIVVAVLLNNMAEALFYLGRHDEAFDKNVAALDIVELVCPPEDPRITAAASNLAQRYMARGDFEKAVTLQRDVLQRRQSTPNPSNVAIALTQNNLAVALMANPASNRAAVEEAFELCTQAQVIQKETFGVGNAEFVNGKFNLAMAHSRLKKYSYALSLHEEVLHWRKLNLVRGHHLIGTSMSSVACLHAYVGKLTECYELHVGVVKFREEFCHSDEAMAESWCKLAGACLGLLNFEGAIEHMQKAVNLARSPALKHARGLYERTLAYMKHGGEPREAFLKNPAMQAERIRKEGNAVMLKTDYSRAATRYTQSLNTYATTSARNNRAQCWIKLERYDDAIADADAVIALEPDNIKALLRKATALVRVGRIAEGRETASKVLALQPKNTHARAILDNS